MSAERITYKKYNDYEHARAVAETLKENGIEADINEDRDSLDSLYGGKASTRQFFVKIASHHFEKANAILSESSQRELENIGRDHYLYSFTDEELFDILAKPDEWNELDVELSKKILAERGKNITPEVIDLLKKQRISELKKPEENQKTWIYAGYFFAFTGGLLGILSAGSYTRIRKHYQTDNVFMAIMRTIECMA